MNVHVLFGLSAFLGLIAWGLVAKLYVWPALRAIPRKSALRVLAIPHTFRFIGLSFLVTGVVSPSAPRSFTVPTAYGDLAATLLALATTIALTCRWAFAIALAWLLNIWGTIDFLLAIYEGNLVTHLDPGALGAAFYIPTVVVPPLLVAHVMSFWLLLTKDPSKGLSP